MFDPQLVQRIGDSQTYRRSLADRLDAQKRGMNNGTLPSALAYMLNSGISGYMRSKDASEKQEAMDALNGGMTEGAPIGTRDGQQPNAPQVLPGAGGAEERLKALDGNPYAGPLSQMLAYTRRQEEKQAAELADQRNWQTQQVQGQRAWQAEQAEANRAFQRSMQQPRQRRIVQGRDGRSYYADNGLPVLQDEGPAPAQAPTVRTIKQPDGSEVAVQFNPQTGAWDRMNAPGGGAAVGDPQKKLTESQSKLTLFKNNMASVSPVLEQMEGIYDPTNFGDAAARDFAPGIMENYLKSEEGQHYQTLASQWAEGALRIATGAAATQPEIDRNTATYFPKPGDTPATVALKREMRSTYERSIEAALGDPSAPQSVLTPEQFAARFMMDRRPQPSTATGGGLGGVQPLDLPPEDSGIDGETWKYLTPEQRKLWR